MGVPDCQRALPEGLLVCGHRGGDTEAQGSCRQGWRAAAKVLKTSGGFHTSLMAPAQAKLGKALDECLPSMKPPTTTVYMNSTASPIKPGTPPKEIVELMKKQLTSPVLWEPSVRAMIKDGVSEFYEVGPMKQIKAMMKRIDS